MDGILQGDVVGGKLCSCSGSWLILDTCPPLSFPLSFPSAKCSQLLLRTGQFEVS